MRTDRRTDMTKLTVAFRALNIVYSRVAECGSLFFFNLDKYIFFEM